VIAGKFTIVEDAGKFSRFVNAFPLKLFTGTAGAPPANEREARTV